MEQQTAHAIGFMAGVFIGATAITLILTFTIYGLSAWIFRTKTEKGMVFVGTFTWLLNILLNWFPSLAWIALYLMCSVLWTIVAIRNDRKKDRKARSKAKTFFQYFPIEIKHKFWQFIVVALLTLQCLLFLLGVTMHIYELFTK